MYMMQVKTNEHDEAWDIPSLEQLTLKQYKEYAEYQLFFMDHHAALRSNLGQYPFAVLPEQIDALIEVLQAYKEKMVQMRS